MSASIRLTLTRVLFMFIGLFMSLLIMELGLRLWAPQLTLDRAEAFSFPCFAEGQFRWAKLAVNKTCPLRSPVGDFPDTIVKTNSLGLRNPEITEEKPIATKRVLFIGDSYTMGWGVPEEKAYPRLVETQLNTLSLLYKVQAINAGFTAAGPSGYYLYLKLQGLKLTPDVVVVGLYLGNDIISRRDIEWIKTDTDGLPEIIRSKSSYVDNNGNLRNTTIPIPYRFPILRSSHLFIYLIHSLFGHAPTQTEELTSNDFVNALVCQYKETCHELDQQKAEVMMILIGMKKLIEKSGAKFVVALIPTDFQIHADAWLKYRLPFPLLHKDRELPNKQFAQWLDEAGIDYIDLLPIFMEHESEQMYFVRDDHWNERGHQIASETISQALLPTLKE
jgi:SGNH hydrolase-like domain, acetyltransferase AlgX